MPRYTAVTPTFTPVDYSTRIRPLEQYKEEYDKRLDALDEQNALASVIGGLVDRNDSRDKALVDMVDNYTAKMQNVSNELLATGDLGSSRRALGELRQDYVSKLLPIQNAYNTRAEAGKAYREAKRRDPSYIGTDPLSHSVSDYMYGNVPDDKAVSGNQLYDFAMKDTAAASARNVLYGKWGLDGNLLNQYFGRQIITGFSEDEVGQALKYYMANNGQDPSEITGEDAKQVAGALRAIRGAIDRTMSKAEGLDDTSYKEALGYAMQGAITGFGYKKEDDYKSYNPSFWLDYQIKKQSLGEQVSNADDPFTPVPFTEFDGDKEVATAKDDIDFLSQMKAHPEMLLEKKRPAHVYDRLNPHAQIVAKSANFPNNFVGYEAGNEPNWRRLQKIAKRYNIDIKDLVVDEANGVGRFRDENKVNEIIDKVADRAHHALTTNILVYNTTKDDNLINQINKRSITSRDISKEDSSGVAKPTGESLPAGGTFRLNPWMKGNSPYFEYVVRKGKNGDTYQIYRVGPDAVDSTPMTYIGPDGEKHTTTYTRYWLNVYKQAMQEGMYDAAGVAERNAMMLAYGSAEQKAKVRSTTDSKL